MLKVSIPQTITRNLSGTGKASGKPYNLDFQTVYIHTLDRNGKPAPFPEKLDIILDRNEQGQPMVYPVGEYQLHPASLYVDQRGSLAVAPRLVPMSANKT